MMLLFLNDFEECLTFIHTVFIPGNPVICMALKLYYQ